MKNITLFIALSAFITTLQAQTHYSADSIKVFSRYNYYLAEQQASVVAILPDSINTNSCQLALINGKHLIRTTIGTTSHRLIASFPLSVLPIGSTALQYRLTYNKKILSSGIVSIVKLAPKLNTTQIDLLTGGLIADGLPFFPFGFYCVPVGDLPEREVVHGFNMIGPYQDNLPPSYNYRKAYMDRCAQVGMKVQYGVNSLVGSGHNGAKDLDKTEDEKLAILKSEIIAFRDHPALLSWYINDEPDGQGRPPKLLEDACKLIHELDPYHPVSIVFMMPQKANDYRNTMDIAMTDPYPIPGPADKVMNDLEQYNKAYHYQKSVWLVPQAFGGQEMWQREPTAHEIRLMTYMGLVSGVKGIQYYVHAAGDNNPQSVSAWSACSDIAVETAQMTSFLLSADDAPTVHSDDPKILTKTFCYKGNLLVIAVNNENIPKSLLLNISKTDTSLSHIADLWFENRNVPFENGQIKDIIDAYGTRVYLVRLADPKLSSLISPNNLMINTSFEKITSPGLAIGSNTVNTSSQKADLGATFFTDPRQSVDGMFSLRLITPTDSGGKKIRFLPLVMNKGNSYTVSIWAKAKQRDNFPAFRLGIAEMQQSNTYTLTNEWKKYSFTYQAPISSTTAILTLELLQQGTAWFDLIQVTPDPVINYHINTDNTASVSVSSSSGKANIRYDFNKEPDNQSPLYQQPVTIKEAGTFYTALFNDQKTIAASKLFIPVNKALRKPVIFNSKYNLSYTAAGDGSLTDGIMGTTAFKDGKWIGFNGTDMDVVLDMQLPTEIKTVTSSFLSDPNSGIFLPSEMDVYTSADGTNYTFEGRTINEKGSVRGEPYLQQFSLAVKNSNVRYIHIVAKTIGAIPDGYLFKGTTSWLFADEILVQ